MLIRFRESVEAALADALDALELPDDDLGVEEPPEDIDAVLASSVAFRLAGEVGAPPPQVAADVAAEIDAGDYDYLGDVTAQGPYVNFRASDDYYAATLEAARDDDYGRLDADRGSIVVEHTSANPSGPIHVGRARNTIVGDALCRVLDFAGHDVDRHYYVNDAGRQMALFTWAYEHFDEDDLPEPERDKRDFDLVRYYRKGNEFLEEGPEDEVEAAEAEIEALIRGMDDGDEATIERVWCVVGRVLEGMRESMNRLGVEFDEYVRETRFMRDGSTRAVVERLKEADEAVHEDGAWQLDLADRGIDKNFVFLRSDGTTLYTTRDLAHHEWKFAHFDRALTVLGEDQRLHATQLHAALEILGNDTDRLEELFYGWVSLPGGEDMSTRQGTGVDLDDLLDEAVDRARREVEDRMGDRIREDDLTEADVERIARQVGIGAVRYDIVAKQPTKAITFEWERALDFEAQSAPYVQYVHARACGILDRADADPTFDRADSDPTFDRADADPTFDRADADPTFDRPDDGTASPANVDATALDAPEERALLETIARFPAVVEGAADEREPHAVATYTRDLAEAFNAFYRECPVLGDDVATETRDARLALVGAARHAVANALSLLGVEAPESM